MARWMNLLLVGAGCTTAVVWADEPRQPQPAQPKLIQPLQPAQPPQPLQPRQPSVITSRLLQMEEELELLQAQLIIKQAQLKMVEVNVAAREARFKLMTEAREKHKEAFNEFDILEARYACEMARAELQVRMAEIREIEVKIKYAQKRLENAKAGRLLPMVEPHGRDFSVDEKALAELAERIARLREQIDRNDEAKKKADIALQAAQQELKQAQALPENNPNRTNGIKQAEIKVQDALGDLNRINRERQELILSLQRLQNEYQQLRGK